MKIAILVAGSSDYFPLFVDKPKSLYHLNGKIQLQRVIEDAKQFVSEKNIIVVAGYKYRHIEEFLTQHYPNITLKINKRYKGPAIYSFKKAIEGENEDIVFMFGDESISRKNVGRICASNRKMAILCHDKYYYYSLGIFKLRKDILDIVNDEKYLSMDELKEIYCFANKKAAYDGNFNINSGICIGYTMIDFVRRIGNIKKIEDPITTYKGKEVDFLYFNVDEEYTPDLDYFSDTDEYKDNIYLRLYSDYISDPIKRIGRVVKRTGARICRTHGR